MVGGLGYKRIPFILVFSFLLDNDNLFKGLGRSM